MISVRVSNQAKTLVRLSPLAFHETDLERLEVKFVERGLEDPDQDPVEGGDERGGRNRVVGEDVGHNGEFRVDRDAGLDERLEQGCEGSSVPVLDFVEEQL